MSDIEGTLKIGNEQETHRRLKKLTEEAKDLNERIKAAQKDLARLQGKELEKALKRVRALKTKYAMAEARRADTQNVVHYITSTFSPHPTQSEWMMGREMIRLAPEAFEVNERAAGAAIKNQNKYHLSSTQKSHWGGALSQLNTGAANPNRPMAFNTAHGNISGVLSNYSSRAALERDPEKRASIEHVRDAFEKIFTPAAEHGKRAVTMSAPLSEFMKTLQSAQAGSVVYRENPYGADLGAPRREFARSQKQGFSALESMRDAGVDVSNPQLYEEVKRHISTGQRRTESELRRATDVEAARKKTKKADEAIEDIKGHKSLAAAAKEQGWNALADYHDKQAIAGLRRFGKRNYDASLAIGRMPDDESSRPETEAMSKAQEDRNAYLKQAGSFLEEQAALKESRAASKWAHQRVDRIDAMRDQAEGKREQRRNAIAEGDYEYAERLRKEIYNLSIKIPEEVAALKALSERLGEHAAVTGDSQADARHRALVTQLDEKREGFLGYADRVRDKYSEQSTGQIGHLLARGLKDIPLIGDAIYRMAGKQVADSWDKSSWGRTTQGTLQGMMGKDLSEELLTSGGAMQGHQVGKKIGDIGRQAAKHPLTWIAVAGGAALYGANKKAARDVEGTAEARQEEIMLGNLGNRLGTTDRIMDDVRARDAKGNGWMDQRLLNLRMDASDYADILGSTQVTGWDATSRQNYAYKGLQLSRSYDLDTSAVAGVASQIAIGDRSHINGQDITDENGKVVGRSGGLERDMDRFGLILSESIKRGVSSDETTRAFSSAIEKARGQGAGILEEAQRGDLAMQLLEAARSGDKRLQGQLGADYLTEVRGRIEGAEGVDLAFLSRALGDKTGAELGLNEEQAAVYDQLNQTNRAGALRYAQEHITGEITESYAKEVVGAYGMNQATLAEGFRSAFGVSKGYSEELALNVTQQRDKLAAKGFSGDELTSALVEAVPALRSLSANAGQGVSDEDYQAAYKEKQGENQAFVRSERQEIRMQDGRIQAQRLTLESDFAQTNIEGAQDAGDQLRGLRGKLINFSNAFNRAVGYTPSGAEGTPAYAEGGHVRGAGSEASDSIVARLSNGEFVVNATSARKHRHLLENINNDRIPAFKRGGAVGGEQSNDAVDVSFNRAQQREQRELTEAIRSLDKTMRAHHDPIRSDFKAAAEEKASFSDLFKNLLGGKEDNIWGKVAGFFGGGSSGGGASMGAADAAGLGLSLGGSNGDIADTALRGLSDSAFEGIAGYCSRFVRQVVQSVHGAGEDLFDDEARQTGIKWKKRGWTKTPAQMKSEGRGYQEGDVLFQMSGSGDYDGDGDDGHVGIVVRNPKTGKLAVAENSTRGRGGKQLTSLADFGRVDHVGRYGGFKAEQKAAPIGAAKAQDKAAGRAASNLVSNLKAPVSGVTFGAGAASSPKAQSLMPSKAVSMKNLPSRATSGNLMALAGGGSPAQVSAKQGGKDMPSIWEVRVSGSVNVGGNDSPEVSRAAASLIAQHLTQQRVAAPVNSARAG